MNQNVKVIDDQTRIDRARWNNKEAALALAAAGIAVLVADPHNKTPLVRAHQRLDTDISAIERERMRREFYDKRGFDPLHIGATTDRRAIRAMFRAKPDALPAISCGPSGLLVVDNDIKDRDGVHRNGPELFDQFCAEHDALPEGAVAVRSQSKGRHIYFSNPDGLGCSAGRLKRDHETDVKAVGGFVIAPSAIRAHDGRSYGTKADLAALIAAFKAGSLPAVPDFLRAAIGTSPKGNETSERDTQKLAEELRAAELPDGAALLDPALDGFDVSVLATQYGNLQEALDSADRSDIRFNLACVLKTERPNITAEEYAAIVLASEECGVFVDDEKPAQGEFGWRNIARDFQRAKRLSGSSGEAFGAVSDDDIEEREAFIANGGTLERWDALQAKWAKERDTRKSRLERARAQSDVDQSDGRPARYVFIEDIRHATLRLLDWCLKWVVARGTTSVATGLWGAGKTAVFSDIGLHVGHGFEWRGRRVKQGVVIYVALENSEDVERRVATWCELMEKAGRDVSKGSFVVYRGPCRLFDPSGKATRDERELIEAAKAAAAHYGLPVAMIVIDTLAQSIMPGNDNDAKDAGIYTAALQRIVAATGANVTALAHPTKSGEGVRGSGALQANVDTVIEISRDASGRGTVKAGSKFRIGNPAKVMFGYCLRSQTIGKDEDGDDISVVLAEDLPMPNLAVEDVDDNEAPTPPDTPADKLGATLRVFKARVEGIAANTGERLDKIGLSAKTVFDALNVDRRASGLPELNDRTIVSRLLGRLAEGGEIVKSGDNRSTEYKLMP